MFAFVKLRLILVLAPLSLLAAGCGSFPASTGGFAISSSATTIATTGQIQFKATLPDGSAAVVSWSASPQNNSSQSAGLIDATGLYTPPNALSSDSVAVEVTAHLESDPSRTASETITVTPGFLQPLLPENAAVAPGTTLEISAQIAEVNDGSVHWSLSDGTMGSIGQTNCQRGSQQYTLCKASYTAPSTFS